ncbi:replication endonuclease [Neokomagataea anthophila]|uniref:Replication endonuclease n=1 Tax=Neokomagataea anthophila TaxID=2826925 RepID=A0ABS5E745_9PROT|nr:replication endonuclease [Neokomagataea anthophila]MBR0559735.1 replication endonuclease [Neokomagataea anthophila]
MKNKEYYAQNATFKMQKEPMIGSSAYLELMENEHLAEGIYNEGEFAQIIPSDEYFIALQIINTRNLNLLTKSLIDRPQNLVDLAFCVKHKNQELRAFENSKTIAWKYLLRLDSFLCNFEKLSESDKTIIDLIEEKLNEINDLNEYQTIKRAEQFLGLSTFAGEAIAKLSKTKLKTITKHIERIRDYTIDNMPEPHEKYGHSFTKLNKYYKSLIKQHNYILHHYKEIKRFVEKGEEKIGDFVDFHEKAGTLGVVSGGEDNIKIATDSIIYKNQLAFKIETHEQERLTPEQVSKGLRISDRNIISRQLRAIGRQGMADLASCLGLVSGKPGNNNHHCHVFVSKNKKQVLTNGKKWAQAVGVRRQSLKNEAGNLWNVIQNKQKQGLASMYSIVKGYEDHANEIGYACFFGTLTLPGEYHPAPKSMGYEKNEAWDYLLHNLKQSRIELSEKFRYLRSRIIKSKDLKGFFGLKTFEFHKDGCPHLHFMLWLPPFYKDKKTGEQRETKELLKHHVEALAPGHGHDIRVIAKEPENDGDDEENEQIRATPTSYIMKYITKGLEFIDPEDMQDDGEYTKYRAMLSACGGRAFSFVGCRGIRTLWNRLYNANDAEFSNQSKEWKEIHYNVKMSKILWNSAKTADNTDEDSDKNELKLASRRHSLQALRLLNVFPDTQNDYKIIPSYKMEDNRFLEETKKHKGWTLITETGEDSFFSLKKFDDIELFSTCDEDKKDITGLRSLAKRKEILGRVGLVKDRLTTQDISNLFGIYDKNVNLLHNVMIEKVEIEKEIYRKNVNVFDDINREVALNYTYPRTEPLAPFTEEEIRKQQRADAENMAIMSLRALREDYFKQY